MLSWFRRGLMNRSFIHSVTLLVSAGVIGQLVQLVASPIVTRLYNPLDFGVFGVFGAMSAILLMISGLRYELAIPLPRSKVDALVLLVLVLMLNGGAVLIAIVLVFFAGKAIVQLVGIPELESILWMLPIVLAGAGSYRAFYFWSIRSGAFSSVARTRIGQSVANAALQIGCGYAGLGPGGLVAGQFAGTSAGTFRLARLVPFSAVSAVRQTMARRMRVLARRYQRFPKFDVAASLIDELSVQLPNILLAIFFGPAVVGHYMLVDRVVMRPLGLISQSVGQVFYSKSQEYVFIGSAARRLLVLSFSIGGMFIIPAIITYLFSIQIFTFVFGNQWEESGIYAGWLIFGFYFQLIYSPMSLMLLATDGQKVNLCIQIIMLSLKGGALILGYLLGSSIASIVALALAGGLGYLGASVAVIAHVHRYTLRSGPRI